MYAPVTGSGQLQIGAGARLALASYGSATTVAVSFTGAGGTLQLQGYATGFGETVEPGGTITGFAPGDMIAYTGPLALTAVTFGRAATGSAR